MKAYKTDIQRKFGGKFSVGSFKLINYTMYNNLPYIVLLPA